MLKSTISLGKEYLLTYFIGGVLLVLTCVEYDHKGDFRVFVEASQALLKGENIYERPFHEDPESNLYYYYSPFFALIISIFSPLPGMTIYLCWKLVNILLLYRIWQRLLQFLDLKNFPCSLTNKLLGITFLMCIHPIYVNFHSVQITIFLLFLCLEGISFIYLERQWMLGSFLIALCINIKFLGLVFLPYLIYRNQWREAGMIVGIWGLLLVFPAIYLGWEYNYFLLHEWWKLVDPFQEHHTIDLASRSNNSLLAIIPAYFSDILIKDYPFQVRRHLMNLPLDQLLKLANICRFAIVCYTLYFLRTLPFTSFKNQLHTIWEISYIFLCIPLIFPQQRPYSFLFALPAISYIIYYWLYHRKFEKAEAYIRLKRKYIFILCVFVFLFINIELILGQFRYYYWYFKFVGIGGLLLIVPLSMCNFKLFHSLSSTNKMR